MQVRHLQGLRPHLTCRQTLDTEIQCLALNIYHEARGESGAGKEAVGWVTMSRMASRNHPASACSVVYAPRQFSWTHDGTEKQPREAGAWNDSLEIARRVYEQGKSGDIPQQYREVNFYHTTSCRTAGCAWQRSSPNLTEAFTIGSHVFYRERG